MSKFWRS